MVTAEKALQAQDSLSQGALEAPSLQQMPTIVSSD